MFESPTPIDNVTFLDREYDDNVPALEEIPTHEQEPCIVPPGLSTYCAVSSSRSRVTPHSQEFTLARIATIS
jgi:hypothetical protein